MSKDSIGLKASDDDLRFPRASPGRDQKPPDLSVAGTHNVTSPTPTSFHIGKFCGENLGHDFKSATMLDFEPVLGKNL